MKVIVEHGGGYIATYEGESDSYTGWKGSLQYPESDHHVEFKGPLDQAYVIFQVVQAIMGAGK